MKGEGWRLLLVDFDHRIYEVREMGRNQGNLALAFARYSAVEDLRENFASCRGITAAKHQIELRQTPKTMALKIVRTRLRDPERFTK